MHEGMLPIGSVEILAVAVLKDIALSGKHCICRKRQWYRP